MLVPKELAGQVNRTRQAGYAMAALLVGLSVMAILATAAMPVWRQMVQREKEEELVFRGQQYARAIGLFQRKAGPGVLPPNLDVLVDQRALRKKYRDPITGEDFLLVGPSQNAPGSGAVAGSPVGGAGVQGTQGGPGGPLGPSGAGRGGVTGAPGGGGLSPSGGIIGVASKSREKSIRIYNGRDHYNEWVFQYVPQTQAPGAAGSPGQAGGPGGAGPQGRGTPQRGGPSNPVTPPAGRGRPGGGGPSGLPSGSPPPLPGTQPRSGFVPR